MQRSLLTLLALAAPAALFAQDAAPIERSYPANPPAYRATNNPGNQARPLGQTHEFSPAPGVRILADSKADTVSSSNAGRTELRLDHGRMNVVIDHPTEGALILVDLPGGQADLTRDGFYTLNADTNTLTVLHGEAVAFSPNAAPDDRGKTVKEGQGAILGQHIHPDDLFDSQAQADILAAPGNRSNDTQTYASNGYPQQQGYVQPATASGYYGEPGYNYPVYAGAYPYPYYAGYYGYGYPWGWDYAWGYPAFGIGIGFGGYYRGGGYYGGYRGGYGYGGYGVHPGYSGGVHASYGSGGVSHSGFSGGHR